MHDFGKLVYLDVQKTGSSFVSHFLRAACTLKEEKFEKHGRISSGYDRDALFFISVRHPVDQYLSLYRYGIDGKGGVYNRVRKHGHADLYDAAAPDGFDAFVRFMIDPGNAGILGEDFPRFARSLNVGLLTHRHLMLSFPSPVRQLSYAFPLRRLNPLSGISDIIDFYRERRLFRHVVYQERLNDDLLRLSAEIAPQYFDQAAAAAFVSSRARINPSAAEPERRPELSARTMAMLRESERLLFDEYYPDS